MENAGGGRNSNSNRHLTDIPVLPLTYHPIQHFWGEADVTSPGCKHRLGFQHGGEKRLDSGKGSWSDEPIQKTDLISLRFRLLFFAAALRVCWDLQTICLLPDAFK